MAAALSSSVAAAAVIHQTDVCEQLWLLQTSFQWQRGSVFRSELETTLTADQHLCKRNFLPSFTSLNSKIVQFYDAVTKNLGQLIF